jgi:DNA invertase Pin-like site-specific DNA recombinase/ssDNA-binding Zn-finger/Zn-ribbon topoisomerase 1
MNPEKLNIAYERLSRDDEAVGDSLSIQNQKMLLDDYASKNGYGELTHIADDGWSGTRWDRPGIVRLMEEVERGNVGLCLVKDMSRLGRDHLRVGLLLEQFRERGVRFIAVNDGVDTSKNDDDFTPFRNIINEWVARDTSRKIRAVNEARTKDGKHVTGAVPYGYLRDPNEKSKWVLDETAAPIVRRIFEGVIGGKTVSQIANELSAEGVLIPTAHWQEVGAGMRSFPNADPTKWSASTVIAILRKQEYMGWCVLNKTVKETYKSKRKPAAPEDMLVFKNAHPAIVDEEMWTVVQRLRGTRRRPERIEGEPNPLTGILYCSDCGHKMYHKQGRTDKTHKPHHEYCCSSYRHYSRSCTMHYIRVVVIEEILLEAIRRVSGYVRENEAEFVKRVRKQSALQQEAAAKESRRKMSQSQRRRDEVSSLIKKLYEAYANEKIPENHFAELLAEYGAERNSLDAEIGKLQAEIEGYNNDTVRADKFIELVKRHTEFKELSAALLNEFVEKVIVHEAVKVEGERVQDIEVFFTFIGKFDVPKTAETEPAREKRKPAKKQRTDREREYERLRYEKKRSARIAAEQAERAAILEGTSFAAQ